MGDQVRGHVLAPRAAALHEERGGGECTALRDRGVRARRPLRTPPVLLAAEVAAAGTALVPPRLQLPAPGLQLLQLRHQLPPHPPPVGRALAAPGEVGAGADFPLPSTRWPGADFALPLAELLAPLGQVFALRLEGLVGIKATAL